MTTAADKCSGKACGEACGGSDGEYGDDGVALYCQADATCGWPKPAVADCTPPPATTVLQGTEPEASTAKPTTSTVRGKGGKASAKRLTFASLALV